MRVLEIAELRGRQGAAAFCGKQLARWGAEVVRVDPPDALEHETGAEREFLHGGKQRVTLDLGRREGRQLLDRLAARCDVLISDLAPTHVDALEFYALGGSGPRVRSSLTPFGLSGPYRDWQATPATLLALCGYTFLMGDPGRAPLTLAGRYPDYQAGLIAYAATLAAWLDRERRPRPAAIEISLFECLASLHQFTVVQWVYQQRIRQRQGNRFEGLAPITLLRCAEGWWGLNVLPQFWAPFAEMIQRPDLLEDERFRALGLRWENVAALEDEIQTATRDWSFDELMRLGEEFRVPVGVALSLEQLLRDPHLEARGFWREVDGVRRPGAPFRLVGEREPVEAPAFPPGAHDALLREVR